MGCLLRQADLPRLGRVLCIGCGDGQFEVTLSPHADSITAPDLSLEAIAAAKRNAARAGVNNIDFRCMPLTDLRWEESFDALLCIAFIHHVPEPDQPTLLRQIHDHLVPGGIFSAQDPNIHGVMQKIGRVVLRSKYDSYHTTDERELDPAEIARLLREASFATARIG